MTKTYRVTVQTGGDRATVTVNGTPHGLPYHWEDSYKGLVRRALTTFYRVDSVESVEIDPRGKVYGGSFRATALVF